MSKIIQFLLYMNNYSSIFTFCKYGVLIVLVSERKAMSFELDIIQVAEASTPVIFAEKLLVDQVPVDFELSGEPIAPGVESEVGLPVHRTRSPKATLEQRAALAQAVLLCAEDPSCASKIIPVDLERNMSAMLFAKLKLYGAQLQQKKLAE
jgi:hypothetical protein